MENIPIRIDRIIKNEMISTRAFEMKIGVSEGVIAKCVKNQTDTGGSVLSKILNELPKYSGDWLLTGNGGMLKSRQENYLNMSDIDSKENIPTVEDHKEGYISLNKKEKTELLILKNENELLKKIILEKNKEIDFYRDLLIKK